MVGGLIAKLCSTLATPWTVVRQISLSLGFSRQEYWSGLLFPSPRDLPGAGIEPASLVSPALAADSLPLEPSGKPMDMFHHTHLTDYVPLANVLSSSCLSWVNL